MLPEDLMLLFLDEKTGRVLMDSSSVENALAGAVLLELVNAGRVSFEANGRKLAMADPTPLTDEFLQESLSRLDKPMVPRRAVEKLRRHVRDNVMARREMNARAKDISAGNWAGDAVKKAMEAVQAAVMAGIAASTAAATSGGGSS